MYYRSKFVTNSSTTAFVCFGTKHEGPDYQRVLARMLELFQEHKEEYLAEVTYRTEDDFTEDGSPYDWVDFMEWIYRREYEKRHPESRRTGVNAYGKEITYVDSPVDIHMYDQEYNDPWIIIYAYGASCDWGPDEVDLYQKSKEQMEADIKEFCEMFGFPQGQPKWWLEGYGVG
jgi:hypothetical protein